MSRWNALVRLCAFTSAVIAIARGATVGDRESIAVGVALILAEFITHLPWKPIMRIGWLALTLLFVNQGGWMIAAVIGLTTAAPSTLGATAPAALAVLATLGFIASLARLQERMQWAVTPLLVLGAAGVVALAVVVPRAGSDAVRRRAGDLSVVTSDVKFKPRRLEADAGTIGIVITNDDLFWHTLTFNGLDENVRVATAGRKRLQLRDVEPGTYKFVCAIPGHEAAGMTGTLVVS
jgi:plastocyanin